MIDHQPGPTVAKLLHEFNPAQPFETARSRTALAYLRSTFKNGRPLAVLGSGWSRGSKQLIHRFLAEVNTAATVLLIPGSCSTKQEGLQALIKSIGFDPRELIDRDLHNILINFLEFQSKRKRRTIIVLTDSDAEICWVRDYVTLLLEMDANVKDGLMVILSRQVKSAQLTGELPLDSLSYRTGKHIAVSPFTQAETRKFVRWRLDAREGIDIGCILEFHAITLIHELCEGVPDAIDHLICASLLLADSEDVAPVTTDIVMRASNENTASPLPRKPSAGSQLTAQPAPGIPTLTLPDGPTIVLDYRGKTIRQIPLSQQRISIGRAVENDLCIGSPFISRQHATIFRNGTETAVVDLDSKNGTFVNARRVQAQTIADQDEITIGRHTIRFCDPNTPRIRALNSIGRSPANSAVNAQRESRGDNRQKNFPARR